MFIGSSFEGLQIAKAIQANLDQDCETTLWSQGVFGLGEGTLETLVDRLDDFDFATLVLTPDDLIKSRKGSSPSPRDNVLLELGLFIGRIEVKYLFRPDYPESEGGDSSGRKIGIGFVSTYNAEKRTKRAEPVRITKTQLEGLKDPRITDTAFQCLLHKITKTYNGP